MLTSQALLFIISSMDNASKTYHKTITKILKCVKLGDKSKMDELFTKTANHFYGYALFKLRDEEKAKDAVMDMYENVLKYIKSFNAGKNGMGWMFTILNNIIKEVFRKENRIKEYEIPLIDENISVTELNRMFDNMGLTEAISSLDDAERKFVFWHYYERRTLSEIAKLVGLSTSAVHKRLLRIEEKLRI